MTMECSAGTSEQERLAEAMAIRRLHGDEGPLWIATRIGALELADDRAGVERFRAIAAAYERLLTAVVQ